MPGKNNGSANDDGKNGTKKTRNWEQELIRTDRGGNADERMTNSITMEKLNKLNKERRTATKKQF